MKYTLLVAVLFSAPLLAVTDSAMEAAQREINEAHAAVKAAENRVNDLSRRIEESSNKAGSYAGKYDQRDHVDKYNSQTASSVAEHNKARKELAAKHQRYEEVRKKLGKQYLINEDGNHISLSKQPEQPAGEAIRPTQLNKTYARNSYRSYASHPVSAV